MRRLSVIAVVLFLAVMSGCAPGPKPFIRQPFPFMTVADREMTATHEAGHALLAVHYFGPSVLQWVSITMPETRGMARFSDRMRPMHMRTEREARNRIAVSLAGIVAEELLHGGHPTVGKGDIADAKKDAVDLLMSYGLGPTGFEAVPVPGFDLTPEMRGRIHRDAAAIVEACKAEAQRVLLGRRDQLIILRARLLKDGWLSGAKVEEILAGK
jgi:ATP-dependent Zn protease